VNAPFMFDIVFINLPHRTGRRRLMRLQSFLLRTDFRRFEALDARASGAILPASTLQGGELGLWGSFFSVLSSADSSNHLLVLEDDALLHPRLFRHIASICARLPEDVVCVQLGALGEGSWRPHLPFSANVRKILRPRTRVRRLRQGFGATDHGRAPKNEFPRTFSRQLGAGTHALLVPSGGKTEELKLLLAPADLPLDHALQRVAFTHPGSVLRSRRNLAWQVPFSSDILKSARISKRKSMPTHGVRRSDHS
jgi:hypothetical protein